MNDVDTLTDRIHNAFEKRRRPLDHSLLFSAIYEDTEEGEILNRLRGREWQDFTFEELIWHSSSLTFMTPEGCAWMLPAFLKVAIRDPYGLDMSFYSLFRFLGGRQDSSGGIANAWPILTVEERRVVLDCMSAMAALLDYGDRTSLLASVGQYIGRVDEFTLAVDERSPSETMDFDAARRIAKNFQRAVKDCQESMRAVMRNESFPLAAAYNPLMTAFLMHSSAMVVAPIYRAFPELMPPIGPPLYPPQPKLAEESRMALETLLATAEIAIRDADENLSTAEQQKVFGGGMWEVRKSVDEIRSFLEKPWYPGHRET